MLDTHEYLFPAMASSSNDSYQQLRKIDEETLEAREAHFISVLRRDASPSGRQEYLIECIDVIHAAETLLRLLIAEFGDDVVDVTINRVCEKNAARGYYTEGD